jgi:hypothetical protein
MILKKILSEYKLKVNSRLIAPSIVLAGYLSLLWTPVNSIIPVTSENARSFNRVIGQALLFGIDINKRLVNMMFFSFLYIPILSILFYGILSFLFKKYQTFDSDEFEFFENFSFSAIPSLIVQYFSRFSYNIFSLYSPIVPIIILILALYIKYFSKKISFSSFKSIILAALAVNFSGLIILQKLFPQAGLYKNTMGSLFIFILWICILCVTAIYIEQKNRENRIICISLTPLMFSPLLVSIFLEFTNILNQYNIFIMHKAVFSFLIVIVCILIGSLICFHVSRRNKPYLVNVEKYHYLIAIVSLSLFIVQPPFSVNASTELFETSNWGSDVVEFLRYGEMPIIENLNVHLLGQDIGGILYGLFNNDHIGAAYFGYDIFTPLTYVVFFLFFSKITSLSNAFLVTLLFPLTGTINFFGYFGIGLIIIIPTIYLLKKESLFSIILFFLTCIILMLYRADLGVMFGFSAVLIIVALLVYEKKWRFIKNLLACGFLIGIMFILLFCILCLLKNISPVVRLHEFIDIMTSNVSWAYRNIVPGLNFFFHLGYLFCPFALIVSLILFLFKKTSSTKFDRIIIFILAFAFLFNYQRGIIRHTLVERQWGILFSTLPLCISLIIYFFLKKRARYLSLCLMSFLILQLLTGSLNLNGETLIQRYFNRQMDFSVYEGKYIKNDRVIFPDQLRKIYEPLKTFFDFTLKDNETYFDYSFDTMLYQLTNRNKPVYLNQSPSQLNGEYSHLAFIKDIEKSRCPYALVKEYNNGWDGIPLNINHYLVAEYLNKYYMPFYRINNYNIWVRREFSIEKKKLLDKLIEENNISYGEYIDYKSNIFPHSYNIEHIAWLWGTYDKIKSSNVQKIIVKDISLPSHINYNFSFDLNAIDLSQGNYIELICDSDMDGEVTLNFSDNLEELLSFSFKIFTGNNKHYLIRASCDPLWYSGMIRYIGLQSNVDLKNVSLKLLQGDTLSGTVFRDLTVFPNLWQDNKITEDVVSYREINSFALSEIIPFVNDSLLIENKYDEDIILICGTSDPFAVFALNEQIIKPASKAYLEIEYTNSKAGNLQVFYDYGQGYSEEKSTGYKRISIQGEKVATKFPIIGWENGLNLKGIRIDPPDGTIFKISAIRIIAIE